jgi:hypothetical protein
MHWWFGGSIVQKMFHKTHSLRQWHDTPLTQPAGRVKSGETVKVTQ